MTSSRVWLGVVATTTLAALGGAAAHADDPKFTYGKADDAKVDEKKNPDAVEWNAAAEAGLIFTTGNSETTTATGGLKVSRKGGDNKLSLEASAAYAKSSLRTLDDRNGNGLIDNQNEIVSVDSVTAETLNGKLRYDRFLTEFNSLFVAALASRDVPAGKKAVYGAQVGYSRRLYKTKTTEAVGEFGYDFSRQELVSGTANSIHSARLFTGVKSAMTEGADVDASVEVLTNLNRETLTTTDDNGKVIDGGAFKDTRVNGHVGISAKVGKNLAVSTTIDLKFDNRPAPLAIKGAMLAMGFVPEAAKLDTIMKASLIYTFF